MANFEIVSRPEPFLHVQLTQGEKIYCESDAMVMMESNLELKGKLQGGIIQSLLRTFATGESLFQQTIEAKYGDGECLLSPPLDGDMYVLNVSPQEEYILSDGAFVAATEKVEVTAKVQSNIGGAIFGGTGGFVVMQAKGLGKLAISGTGTMMELNIDTKGNEEVTIDNGHVVAWDSSLTYSVGMPRQRDSGFLGTVMNSLTSGEGLVIRFKGKGKVYISSRNKGAWASWIMSLVNQARSN